MIMVSVELLREAESILKSELLNQLGYRERYSL